jgi:alpha-glucosidase
MRSITFRRIVFCCLIFLALAAFAGCHKAATRTDQARNTADDDDNDDATPDRTWWRGVVFQEIFVRSYQDSDGDGIGDFPGLISRLPYLADLGVGGVWLMPMYPTPFFDSGYDVADYEAINPDYGTMTEFQTFLAEAHKLGIRVFIDGVFNHTSWDHPWFKESRSSRTNPKRDWYEWADKPLWNCGGGGSQFGSDRWEWDATTQQYYYHSFLVQQPDLNWANPAVLAAIEDVLRFWFDMGVDGFRLDAVGNYYEDATVCVDAPQTHAIMKAFRTIADEYPDRAFVGEAGGDLNQWVQWFGNGTDELHMAFNFNLTDTMYAAFYAQEAFPITMLMAASYDKIPRGGQQAVFVNNHDFFRYYDLLFRDERRCQLAGTLELTLPGTPFIYYGEEVGVANGDHVHIDYRDMARTPMAWDDSAQAGFTTGTPWLPLSWNHATNNAAVEDANRQSLRYHFRRMIAIRNASDALRFGDYREVVSDNPNVLAFFRTTDREVVLVAINFSHLAEPFELDLSLTPWDNAAGRVHDLYAGADVQELTAANTEMYPGSLPPFGFEILKLEAN